LWLGDAVRLDTIAVHGAARLGEWYLDGDGFSSPHQMRGRWGRSAGRATAKALSAMSATAIASPPGALRPLSENYLHDAVNADMVLKLARRMRTHLDRPRFLALLNPEIESLGL
jgi:hypothetical protein